MKCPFCGENNDRVVDSRAMSEGAAIRRRRECISCQKRFTTYERVEDIPIMVIKRDRRREGYDRAKIAGGIRKACQKRPISEDQIEKITNEVELQIHQMMEKEIESTVIGRLVMEKLHSLDQVAYVRFASVYRKFRDVDQFIDDLKEMWESQKPAKENEPKE
jgi:transcriptional repressor NrdR